MKNTQHLKEDLSEKTDEAFAQDDAIRAGCGCTLGIIVFIVILLFGVFGK